MISIRSAVITPPNARPVGSIARCAFAGSFAQAHALQASYGYVPFESVREPAGHAVTRALQLAPASAEAHAAAGLLMQLRGDEAAAARAA